MDKNNLLKEALKLVNLILQVYLESSNTISNIENYIKKSAKYLIGLILILIPILLTIWGGVFLGIFFYITTHLKLSNYTAAFIIAIFNIFLFIICLFWFKSKMQRNHPEKDSIGILLIKLMRHIKTAN